MNRDPAFGVFCSVATLTHHELNEDPDEDCETLTLMNGGWCGPVRDQHISVSCQRKVKSFLETRPAVLHADEIINKKKEIEVRYLLQELLRHRMPVQVAFLQGAVPLQSDSVFPRLLELLVQCPVWSINLGELRFSEEQCSKLADSLRLSGVTHMFYECTVAGQWKDVFRTIIRQNRAKHGLWRLGPDAEQNRVVLAAVKSWYCPTSHACNKQWMSRHHTGWSDVERVQCEACGKWRRLPASLDGWPRLFYCALNTWDPRLASCEAQEEEWATDLPMSGDVVHCKLDGGVWLEGQVKATPKKESWAVLPRVGMPQPEPAGCLEAQLEASKRLDLGAAPTLSGGRARKQVQLYDASTSSTEYTRALRRREADEEELRKLCVAVEFVDGVTRCVRLEMKSHASEWAFQREWASKAVGLRAAYAPPTASRLAPGQILLYRVDGKAWRQLRLLRRGMPRRLWAELQDAKGKVTDAWARAELHDDAAAAQSDPTPCLKEVCLPASSGGACGAEGGGAGGGGDGQPQAAPAAEGGGEECGAGSCSKEAAPPPSVSKINVQLKGSGGAGAERRKPSKPRRPESAEERDERLEWWRCSYGRVRLLVRLTEATRMHLWHAPSDAQSCTAASAPDDPEDGLVDEDDDEDDDDEEEEEEIKEEKVATAAEMGGKKGGKKGGGLSGRKRRSIELAAHSEAAAAPVASPVGSSVVRTKHSAESADGAQVSLVLRMRETRARSTGA